MPPFRSTSPAVTRRIDENEGPTRLSADAVKVQLSCVTLGFILGKSEKTIEERTAFLLMRRRDFRPRTAFRREDLPTFARPLPRLVPGFSSRKYNTCNDDLGS